MSTRRQLEMIVAVGAGRAIGRSGELPWHAPEDLRHFRATTLGHAVIIGSTTWESIGRTLPGRHLVVVTTRTFEVPDNVELAASVDEALDVAFDRDDAPIVAGGASIYEQLIDQTRRIHLTEIAVDVPDADTHFPALDPSEWKNSNTKRGSDTRLTFSTLDRVNPTNP